jgi:hypothetical protein
MIADKASSLLASDPVRDEDIPLGEASGEANDLAQWAFLIGVDEL